MNALTLSSNRKPGAVDQSRWPRGVQTGFAWAPHANGSSPHRGAMDGYAQGLLGVEQWMLNASLEACQTSDADSHAWAFSRLGRMVTTGGNDWTNSVSEVPTSSPAERERVAASGEPSVGGGSKPRQSLDGCIGGSGPAAQAPLLAALLRF